MLPRLAAVDARQSETAGSNDNRGRDRDLREKHPQPYKCPHPTLLDLITPIIPDVLFSAKVEIFTAIMSKLHEMWEFRTSGASRERHGPWKTGRSPLNAATSTRTARFADTAAASTMFLPAGSTDSAPPLLHVGPVR